MHYRIKVEARSFDDDLLEKWEDTRPTDVEAIGIGMQLLAFSMGKHNTFQTSLSITAVPDDD